MQLHQSNHVCRMDCKFVHVIKKNGSLRVCIEFYDLNAATPKDEYPMPIAEMLIDSAAGFEYLSMLDGY